MGGRTETAFVVVEDEITFCSEFVDIRCDMRGEGRKRWGIVLEINHPHAVAGVALSLDDVAIVERDFYVMFGKGSDATMIAELANGN